MSINRLWGTARAAFLLVPAASIAADPLENLPYNLAGGAPNVDVRTRYESVDQDSMDAEADAATLRARVGYTTGRWNGLDAQVEYEGLTTLGSEHFNSSSNHRTQYPMVADPEFNEVNQAWIRYSGIPSTTLKYGRQRLVFDNQRFIGNSGWRQNEQTYDAFEVTTSIVPRTVVDYGYINNINAFRPYDFDPTAAESLRDDIDVKGHFLHVAITAVPKTLTLTPYALLLDFEAIPAPAMARQDTRTLGVRATGTVPVQATTFSYALEYADQSDYKDAPSSVGASYSLAEATLAYRKVKGTLGYEKLGGDGTYSFQTPLATLHAFQGWADQFLVTPVDGIEDVYATLGGSLGKASMSATWHDYHADRGGAKYGTEVDLLATFAVIDSLTIGAKFAAYQADELPVAGTPPAPYDTTRMWVWADYKF